MAGTTPDQAPQTPATVPGGVLSLVFSRQALESPQRWLISEGVRALGRAVPAAERATAIEIPSDSRLSQLHARITAQSQQFLLRDEESRNGTYVNGQRIEEHVLADGDLLRMGDSLFVFRDGRQAASRLSYSDGALIAESPPLCALLDLATKVATRSGPVVLLGETGSGKEEIARFIHRKGRPGKPLIAVNCATLTPELSDSALFGHVRGAFTGAAAPRLGCFREARDGTLFLDEIGELPTVVQAKLLRALAEGKVTPVGSAHEVDYEARVIAATNRELEDESSQGRFRKDLFYRVRAAVLRVPPLRTRREDILPILLSRLPPGFWGRLTRPVAEVLLLHDWPDNVRGVVNLAEFWLTHFDGGGPIELSHLPEWILVPTGLLSAPSPAEPRPAQVGQSLARISRERLSEHLDRHRGNIAAVARAESCSEKQVRRWLAAYGMDIWKWRAR